MLLLFSIYLSETYPSIVGQTWHVCSNGSVNVGEKTEDWDVCRWHVDGAGGESCVKMCSFQIQRQC